MVVKSRRHSYGRLKKTYRLPNLIKIQLDSYTEFLQVDVPKTKRKNRGLEAIFREVFPIISLGGIFKLEYLYYDLGKPKYNVDECKNRSMTYGAPFRIKLRLKSEHEMKEQEVYVGEIPLMTDKGTFIINGDERVVVNQLHRSPGISFEETGSTAGKMTFTEDGDPIKCAVIVKISDKGEYEFYKSVCP